MFSISTYGSLILLKQASNTHLCTHKRSERRSTDAGRETERKLGFMLGIKTTKSLVEFGALCWGGRLCNDSCAFPGPWPDLWTCQTTVSPPPTFQYQLVFATLVFRFMVMLFFGSSLNLSLSAGLLSRPPELNLISYLNTRSSRETRSETSGDTG